jgi:geranylgeranyl diphosphate synthase type I
VASLIHDDIIDEDDLRRGRESVPYRFGIGDAIVAGDALIFDMFASLVDCQRNGIPSMRVVAALEAVARAGVDLCRGQSLEAELSRDRTFQPEAYLTVAKLKTASFFRGACESGALLAGGARGQVCALARYGESLGIAFQIHDDLLAYNSDTLVTGKPATSDVHNGRLTLPVILAYESAEPAERRFIVECLSSSDDAAGVLASLGDYLRRSGALAAAAETARAYAKGSRDALEALPDSPSRDRLTWVADLVINRDH